MATMLEALRNANLVDANKAQKVSDEKRQKLASEERINERCAAANTWKDAEAQEKQERFLRGAAKETTQASSRVGTKQYYDRFKKK